MTDLIISLSLIAIAIVILLAIITGKFSHRNSGIATLTAFHDFQPKDKQEAIEIIVEQKSGKQWVEQESSEGVDEGNKE